MPNCHVSRLPGLHPTAALLHCVTGAAGLPFLGLLPTPQSHGCCLSTGQGGLCLQSPPPSRNSRVNVCIPSLDRRHFYCWVQTRHSHPEAPKHGLPPLGQACPSGESPAAKPGPGGKPRWVPRSGITREGPGLQTKVRPSAKSCPWVDLPRCPSSLHSVSGFSPQGMGSPGGCSPTPGRAGGAMPGQEVGAQQGWTSVLTAPLTTASAWNLLVRYEAALPKASPEPGVLQCGRSAASASAGLLRSGTTTAGPFHMLPLLTCSLKSHTP